MTDSSKHSYADDVEVTAAICQSIPAEVARKALFLAITSLSLASTGEVPPPPKSSPVDIIVGLLGSLGLGVSVTTIPGRVDAEEAKKILDEALAKAAKK